MLEVGVVRQEFSVLPLENSEEPIFIIIPPFPTCDSLLQHPSDITVAGPHVGSVLVFIPAVALGEKGVPLILAVFVFIVGGCEAAVHGPFGLLPVKVLAVPCVVHSLAVLSPELVTPIFPGFPLGIAGFYRAIPGLATGRGHLGGSIVDGPHDLSSGLSQEILLVSSLDEGGEQGNRCNRKLHSNLIMTNKALC